MWRRFGDVTFGALVTVVATVQGLSLAWLLWTFARRWAGETSGSELPGTLVAAVASAGLGVALITVYVLVYQGTSRARERRAAERRDLWVARLLPALLGDGSEATSAIPAEARDALLELRDTLRGPEAELAVRLIRDCGLADRLRERLGSHLISARLEALEGLSRARLPEALPAVIRAIGDPVPAARVAAVRAAARTLAVMPPGRDRERSAAHLADALAASGLPPGVVEEGLLLAEDAAGSLVDQLLRRARSAPPMLRAALEAVGHMQLLGYAAQAAELARHADAEVRAAALRALVRLGFLPPEAHGPVVEALSDEVEFVRIHATRAARLLPWEEAEPALWERLADRSWWVRRRAAEAFTVLGGRGARALARATREHPDRYGRDMAAQVLRDTGLDVAMEPVG